MPKRYWLMKTEPDTFSIDDLKQRPKKTEPWDGVRNYQARNYMRDQMQVGDGVFFYHSSCEVPGIYGLAEVASTAYPDPSQFDAKHHHYDPGSKREEPRWFLVDVKYKRHLKRPLTLEELKQHEQSLQGLALLQRGNRLSVSPVRAEHWDYILALE
ncbi:MAG: EVE domain-containing protein [Stagnimonas sp.]|nr:EVE domain-containing protein [Stagnimonas sp.]